VHKLTDCCFREIHPKKSDTRSIQPWTVKRVEVQAIDFRKLTTLFNCKRSRLFANSSISGVIFKEAGAFWKFVKTRYFKIIFANALRGVIYFEVLSVFGCL
jgi:hypothetical protein